MKAERACGCCHTICHITDSFIDLTKLTAISFTLLRVLLKSYDIFARSLDRCKKKSGKEAGLRVTAPRQRQNKHGKKRNELQGATTSTMVYNGDKQNGTGDPDKDVCQRGWWALQRTTDTPSPPPHHTTRLLLADVEKSL